MPLDVDFPGPDQTLTELQEENRRLRTALQAVHTQDQRGVSRRTLLAGGGAVLAASAGAGMFAPLKDVSAAPEARRVSAKTPPPGGSRLLSQFYLQVVGARQGRFIGEIGPDGVPDLITGLKYDHAVKSPRDVSTGQSVGKRQHQPLLIVKEIDVASPMMFAALISNENLPTVTVSFLGDLGAGNVGVVYIVTLINAQVASFEQMIGNVADEEETTPRILEEVSFTYQRIKLTSVKGNLSVTDDWVAQ